MAKENNKDTEGTNYWPLIILSVGVIGLFALSWWWLSTIGDSEKQGQFGDQFGAVNALFSGLAFAGLIFTIILQKKELALQREELTDTKEELRGQKEQLKIQNKTLKVEQFENTFFHMLELQQQIVSDLYVKVEDKEWIEEDSPTPEMGRIRKQITVERVYQGRNLFRYAFEDSIHYIKDSQARKDIEVYGLAGVMRLKGFSQYDAYNTSTYFDHYFRHFYRILKFINKNEDWLTFDEQYQYASMLRATLSRYELVWLYYNGLSENGCEKLKPLMERYSMLKNIRPDFLTLSRENEVMLKKAAVSDAQIREAGFTYRDYDFFLTDQKGVQSKYYFGVFFNKEELSKGQDYYNRWMYFCEARKISIS